METIGHRIAAFRGLKRWTQQHLASELGLSQSALSDIEHDKTSPTWDLLNRVAQALDVPVTSILPTTANAIFNNQSNEAVHNIANQYGGNFDQERRLWQELLKAKDELLAEREATILRLSGARS